jgi:hypothetical protein
MVRLKLDDARDVPPVNFLQITGGTGGEAWMI